MTAATVDRPCLGPDWPEGALYHSYLGLLPFQEEGVVLAYMARKALLVYDTGTGKTHIAMRLATLLKEDAVSDLTLVVCEKNKIGEWVDDFTNFTTLTAMRYHGPGRLERFEKARPDVLVTTYETAKADLARPERKPNARGYSYSVGPLLALLEEEGAKVDVIYDEVTKLKNRASGNYKAQDFFLKRQAKTYPDQIRLGMTATPLERDWEDSYNEFRLLNPKAVPLVAEFERRFVRHTDERTGKKYFHEDRMHEFVAMVRPMILRKRKTDPDVVDQFPKKVEEAVHIKMAPDQEALYSALQDIGDGVEDVVPGLWVMKRMVANHPASIVLSAQKGESELAKALVEVWGEETFTSVSSAKTEALLARMEQIVNGQGAKAVVFTFFGQSVLPLLREALEGKGFKVYTNHGGMSAAAQEESRRNFRADPLPCIFLTSDAGSRGINLPEATYVDEYESALTYANRTQRLDRIHRIDSQSPSVTCTTYILDDTVEVDIIETVMKRNEYSDMLLGDDDAGEEFLQAADRKGLLRVQDLKTRRRKAKKP